MVQPCHPQSHRALEEFARRLKDYLPGILAHCRWPLHTSLLEGINNKIKVIKRMAYGFRDDEYFSSRSELPFPEIPDEPKIPGAWGWPPHPNNTAREARTNTLIPTRCCLKRVDNVPPARLEYDRAMRPDRVAHAAIEASSLASSVTLELASNRSQGVAGGKYDFSASIHDESSREV